MKPDEKWLKLDFGLLTLAKGSVHVSHFTLHISCWIMFPSYVRSSINPS